MAKLLAFFVLSLSSLSLWAGGSVAVIPNAPAFKAILTGVSCPWATTAMASAAVCFAQWKRNADETVGGAGVSCWLQIRNSLTGSDDQPQVLRRQTVTVRQSPPMLPGEKCATAGQVTESASPIEVWRSNRALCPANSTGNTPESPTACYCNGAYKPNDTATACVADCTADERTSTGYFNVGTDPTKLPPLVACSGNCRVTFYGSTPDQSVVTNGVKNWYANGSYYMTGAACTPGQEGSEQVGDSTPQLPPETCGANQGKAQMNGKTVCVDQGKNEPTDETTNKGTKTVEKSTVTNADGSSTTTEVTTEIDSKGNKTVTTTKTTTRPDGSSSSETTTTNNGKGTVGGKPGEGEGEDDGDEEKGKCEKNSSDEGCGGKPATVSEFYSAKEKTMGSVLGAQRDAFMASPVGGAVGGFFNVSGGGSCPRWNARIPFLDADLSMDQFCSDFARDALAVLKVALLLGSSFFAFRVAVE